MALPSRAQIITTYAGNGTAGYSGNGGSATSAEINNPRGVATDGAGNLYIFDNYNCVIRKVNTAGVITTVAGNDNCGYSGDGGPATSAELNLFFGFGVTADVAGNLYIADNENHRVRKVSAATGIITTIAGNGTDGYSGDGGPATSAELYGPSGVAVDTAGNLYIGDSDNCTVRKVNSAGVITTVAGEGPSNCGFSGDGGPATSAELGSLHGIVTDGAGDLYIADTNNCVIRKVNGAGVITTVAGIAYNSNSNVCGDSGNGGPAGLATLDNPYGLAFDAAGNLYIGDAYSCAIREINTAGIINSVAGEGTNSCGYTGDGGPATLAELNSPNGVAVDPAGNLYIGDQNNQRVRKVPILVRPASTTTLTSSPNPSSVGESVTFTAAVSPAGPPTPTGTMTFAFNGTIITGCSAVTLSSSGTATCLTTALPLGTDSIVAYYSGDTNYDGGSGTLSQHVEAASATTVTPSVNPSYSGEPVTFTATVASGSPAPTGTVSFTSDGSAITGCSDVSLSASLTAVCTTAALAVGTDAIVATYSGDSNYVGSMGSLSQVVNATATPLQFFAVTPCRVVDTRRATGTFGGPAIAAGTARSFAIPAGPCSGIPDMAAAYSLNVTVLPVTTLGYLTIWPTGDTEPVSSTLNSLDGRTKANAAIVPAGTGSAVSVYANNASNVLLDIDGYFAASSTSSLEFFPLAPCRVADTRKTDGPLGGPVLAGATERDFPILSSTCGIPSTAKAYSLNFTVVPPATGDVLDYLTVWPEGESKPVVSTLNNFTGTIVANAAIVPAGTDGGVAVYPSDATNLLIDVNGYFATPGTGGYNLYTVAPCRVLDTRKTTGAFTGTLTVNVASSACAPPSTAQGYVFNATVVPSGDLGYLTLWPDGETQPVVSTLNAADGAITSNMAIVPNGDGKTDAYASGTTQLVLDISAYFAP
jgi:sugar lactone lactonase YvrE